MLLESTRIVLSDHARERWAKRLGRSPAALEAAVRGSETPSRTDKHSFTLWLCRQDPHAKLYRGRFVLVNRGHNAIFLVDPQGQIGHFLVVTVANWQHVRDKIHNIPTYSP